MKEKKVVLITGSSSNLGQAIARKFAQQNNDLILHYYQQKEKTEALKQELEEVYPIKILLVHADIGQESEVKIMMNGIAKTFPHLDVLVNNAAFTNDLPFEEKTSENFQRTLDVNLLGTFFMCKYGYELMKEKNQGVIINVASTNGIDTFSPLSLEYDASKAGIISLTKNLAIQFSPIRVNAIAPGWIENDTDLFPDFKKKEEDKILLKRFAHPSEIVSVIAFLASEDASYIHGTTIRVDGGQKS